jgi:hypothetical protein
MELTEYRAEAGTFLQSLEREYYEHFAGHKDDFALEAIYDRHPQLFTEQAVEARLAEYRNATPGSDEQRRARILADFTVDGRLGALTKELEGELARREAALTVEIDGEAVPFRQSSVIEANEPDAARRAAIQERRNAATSETLNPIARELSDRRHAAARELGWSSYRAMCEELKGVDMDALRAETSGFLQRSAAPYAELFGRQLEEVTGVRYAEFRQSDAGRFRRAPALDGNFPAARLLDTLHATTAAMGIDLAGQANVHLDVESRPNKSPRAFCAPVCSPDEVYLVIAPTGGRDDFEALFHEAGHTEHFAHMDRGLPFEFRHLGDNAITEAFAFLFEHLIESPRWLARHLQAPEPERLTDYARASRLFFVRRYAAKLDYELALHGDENLSQDALADLYARLQTEAVGAAWARENYLTDVDPGFYCTNYLRAWALEAHLRRLLIERYGEAWFEDPQAAATLREWWAEGQRLTAAEFLAELTGERLGFDALLEDVGLA